MGIETDNARKKFDKQRIAFEKLIKKIRKDKPKFEKLSYAEKLIYWRKNCDPLSGGYREENDEIIIEIYPKNDNEREQYNAYYFKEYIKLIPKYDFQVLKKGFFEVLKKSMNIKKYIESEIKECERQQSYLSGDKKNFGLYTEYEKLFKQYEERGEKPDWKKVNEETVQKFALVKALIDYKYFLNKQLEEIKNLNSVSMETPAQSKLNWNGQSNALIDIFSQLKNIHNNKREPLIPNSSDEIAYFLKNNFDCFSETAISTIRTQLDKKEIVKKTEKRIFIECKKK